MIEKDALEFLIKEGEEKNPIIKLDQGTFSAIGLQKVKYPAAATLEISTLTGLVDYIKSNIDKIDHELLIHVESHKEIALYGPLGADREREQFLQVEAILPNNVRYNNFIDTEQFNIMLQSGFVDNDDKILLLKYTGLVRDEAVKDTGDDGVSQAVTIKTGVASVGQAIVPNPVILAPYRTFLEVEQPESKFIFRMQSGPRAALFEADGGAWRNEAIQNIKEYLEDELQEVENVKIIS